MALDMTGQNLTRGARVTIEAEVTEIAGTGDNPTITVKATGGPEFALHSNCCTLTTATSSGAPPGGMAGASARQTAPAGA